MMEQDSDSELEIDEELKRDVQSLMEVLETARSGSSVVSGENTTLQQLQLCLSKNVEVQSELYSFLRNIDQALAENRSKRERLRTSGSDCFKQTCTLLKFRKTKSYFRDHMGKSPDLARDFRLPARKNVYFEDTTWCVDTDDSLLKQHVIVQAIEIVCKPLQHQLSQTTSEEEIRTIKAQMKELSNLSSDDRLLTDVEPDEINWTVVAQEAFNNHKTAFECYQRWINVLSPGVNSSPWTKEETIKLMKLGNEFEGRRWNEIAERIGTQRSVFSYFQKYQTAFADTKAKFWSSERDKKLKEVAGRYTGEINWYDVAKHVGFSAGKCRQRWLSYANPNIKKGRWTAAEDKLLKEAHAKYGTCWKSYANVFPNRTPTQCRERWVNVLDPKIQRGCWKPDEDKKLMQLCKQYEGNVIPWAKVAASLPNRTDSSCLVRWRILSSSDDLAKYHKSVKMNAKLKQSNNNGLKLSDFDDDMIPRDLRDEIKVYQKKAEKRAPFKDREPTLRFSRVSKPPATVNLRPSLDIGNMLTVDQLKQFGAVPITKEGIVHPIPPSLLRQSNVPSLVFSTPLASPVTASTANFSAPSPNLPRDTISSTSPVCSETASTSTLVKLPSRAHPASTLGLSAVSDTASSHAVSSTAPSVFISGTSVSVTSISMATSVSTAIPVASSSQSSMPPTSSHVTVTDSTSCKLPSSHLYSSFKHSPVRKLSSKEAQQLIRKGVPLLTMKKTQGTKNTGMFPPSNVIITMNTPQIAPRQLGISTCAAQRKVNPVVAHQQDTASRKGPVQKRKEQSSSSETGNVVTAKFDQLVDSIQSEKFNHECFVVKEAEACNEKDLVVFTYEPNPKNKRVRRKRPYHFTNPSRKKRKRCQ